MILGPAPRITGMTPPQSAPMGLASQPAQPVLGGQSVQSSPLTMAAAAQTPALDPQSADVSSGLNGQILAGMLRQKLQQQQQKNQPNTPAQTLTGMTNAGATPAQAAQVAQAPNGATSDYAAGYTGPDAAPPGTMDQVYGVLASLFSGSGGGR